MAENSNQEGLEASRLSGGVEYVRQQVA